MSTVPVAWVVLVGTAWHSVHAMAARSALPPRCVWWAPTAMVVVAVSPLVPLGGAAGFVARVASPWHEVQERLAMSSTPFMCLPPATSTVPSGFMVAGWHWAQAVRPPVTDGWPLAVGGGMAWQVPQAAWVPSTWVHFGCVFVPPAASVPPWQYVLAHEA